MLFCFSELTKATEMGGKIYVLKLHYAKGNISLINVSLKEGYADQSKILPGEYYECKIVSFSGQTLYSLKFSIPNKISTIQAPGPITLEEVDFALLIPYFKEAKAINIYDGAGNLELSVDISKYSEPSKTGEKAGRGGLILGVILVLVAIAAMVIIYRLFYKKGQIRIADSIFLILLYRNFNL